MLISINELDLSIHIYAKVGGSVGGLPLQYYALLDGKDVILTEKQVQTFLALAQAWQGSLIGNLIEEDYKCTI